MAIYDLCKFFLLKTNVPLEYNFSSTLIHLPWVCSILHFYFLFNVSWFIALKTNIDFVLLIIRYCIYIRWYCKLWINFNCIFYLGQGLIFYKCNLEMKFVSIFPLLLNLNKCYDWFKLCRFLTYNRYRPCLKDHMY